MMISDAKIQQDVIDQIRWNPLLNVAEIGVVVKDGIVTLSGQVDSYLKKVEAEKEARKVAGVKAIAEDLQVGPSPRHQKTDADIAQAVVTALRWHTAIPEDKVAVKVENGFVILEGEVEWGFQRDMANQAVMHLPGVRSVINNITLKYKPVPGDVHQRIKAAFQRNTTIDADRVQVEVKDNTVILSGQVRSFAEMEDAENAAWSAPGIQAVENKLTMMDLIPLEEDPGFII
jgi:osmotically-inducible protein OsmY